MSLCEKIKIPNSLDFSIIALLIYKDIYIFLKEKKRSKINFSNIKKKPSLDSQMRNSMSKFQRYRLNGVARG